MAADLTEATTAELLEEVAARLDGVEFPNADVFRVRIHNVLEYLPEDVLTAKGQ